MELLLEKDMKEKEMQRMRSVIEEWSEWNTWL